jgi:hypothetical protein
LLSHSHLPEALFSLKDEAASLESLSKKLAKIDPHMAFWLGILNIVGEQQKETA